MKETPPNTYQQLLQFVLESAEDVADSLGTRDQPIYPGGSQIHSVFVLCSLVLTFDLHQPLLGM